MTNGGGLLWTLGVVMLAGLLCACAQTAPSPSSPTVSSPPRASTITVSFRVFDSALGEIPSAAFTTIYTAPSSGDSTQFHVLLPLSQVQVPNVDPLRAALYEPHQGTRLGRFVTSTTDGTLTLPQHDASYDLFMMSTLSRVAYASLDAVGGLTLRDLPRYATLRMAGAGEDILGYHTLDASDESFRFTAAAFTNALNPFGLPYGRVDYIEGPTADITSGMVAAYSETPITCNLVGAVTGRFWVNSAYTKSSALYPPIVGGICWAPPMYYYHVYGGALAMRGLSEAYLGAPDGIFIECILTRCPEHGTWTFDPAPPLTDQGKDAVRYWALMNGALR